MKKDLKTRSLFQLIDRKRFNFLAHKWDIDYRVRNFCTWEMTQALLSCFVLRLGSFREVEKALQISDSSFGDALRKRNHGFFQDLCDLILNEIRAKTKSRKTKKAIRQLLAIDSTDIKVHGSLFDEPCWKSKYTIGHRASAKLHVVWNVDGEWVDDFIVGPGRLGDSSMAFKLRILPCKIYVFDRAYNDTQFWNKIIAQGSDFVTRLKTNERDGTIEKKVLRENVGKSGVLYDEKFKSGSVVRKSYGLKLRHIIYRDKLTQKLFHFVTSDFKLSAKSIADIYKRRWAVELLFRWLKGHLDIRYLPTKTPNSIKTQLAAAVLFQLLLQLKKTKEKYKGTLWELLREIRTFSIRKILQECDFPKGCRWKGSTDLDFRT